MVGVWKSILLGVTLSFPMCFGVLGIKLQVNGNYVADVENEIYQ